MARIEPFRGYRFNPGEVGDLNKVVTQPYDKIDETLQDVYLKRHEFNIVRIIKGPTKPLDTINDNQYTRAAQFWNQWIEDKIFTREPGPAIYPYTQEFTVEGKTHLRKGLIALVALNDKKLTVRAHEKTLTGPKADRLKLMRATEANDGQIFMLYDDPAGNINQLMESEIASARPLMEVRDDDEATHRLYRLSRPGLIADVADHFTNLDLFIADGHHRFETALNYMNECLSRNWKPVRAETFTHRMMTMVNMRDPGLVILPTHRLVHSLPNFNPSQFLTGVANNFSVVDISDREKLYSAMDAATAEDRVAFGFGSAGSGGLKLIVLNNASVMDKLVTEEHSAAWKQLDVTVLHVALLENLLGIDAAKLAAESNVHYVRGRDQALDHLSSGKFQAAFLLNPTRIEQVRTVAAGGERMPQKSTEFYPKLLTGMVLMKMTIDKSMGLAVWQSDE